MIKFAIIHFSLNFMHRLRPISCLIPAVVMASLLTSCSDSSEVVTICKNDKTICTDLHSEELCQIERHSLIISRFAAKNTTNEQTQYALLTALSHFQECIKTAALIDSRTSAKLKTLRISAMLSTYDELIALENQTLNSNNPYILNYHWLSHNNKEAKQRFIALSQQQSFDDPALYFAIANIYANNIDQVIANLLQGISLLDVNGQFDSPQLDNSSDMTTKLFYAIITAYMHKKEYQRAYLWSQVAIISDVKNINLTLFHQHKITASNQQHLDKLAARVAKQIEDQAFTDESYKYTLSAIGL